MSTELQNSIALFEAAITVDERLERLGLTREDIILAVLAGEAARASCTENDPPILSGILAWGRTVRALGEALIPRGWVRRDEANFSVVLNKRLGIAIAVATGDDSTGLAEATPHTKYPKGPATRQVVRENYRQLNLFGSDDPEEEASDAAGALTFILLIARAGREIRHELSLPSKVAEDGRVEGWRERIIFDPIRLDAADAAANLEPTEAIDLEISTKDE